MGLRGWSLDSPRNKFNMADGGHIEFRKMLISPNGMNILAQNFAQRCNATTQRCPSDQKTEPEVNSHDAISGTPETDAGRSQQLYEVFEPNLVRRSRNRQP